MRPESVGGNPPPNGDPTKTVLVVDDEMMVRQYIVRILKETGYEVMEAEDGRQALAVLERNGVRVPLIVCDLVMPGMTGLDLAQQIAQRWPSTRMLFVSGYPRDALTSHGLFHPSIALLAKPFLPSRLLESVEDLRSGAIPDIASQLAH